MSSVLNLFSNITLFLKKEKKEKKEKKCNVLLVVS
jgi:hypothetical protein